MNNENKVIRIALGILFFMTILGILEWKRLRVTCRDSFIGIDAFFQFLNGTIESIQNVANTITSVIFQFLNGAIKSLVGTFEASDTPRFQFLNGAIKRFLHRMFFR